MFAFEDCLCLSLAREFLFRVWPRDLEIKKANLFVEAARFAINERQAKSCLCREHATRWAKAETAFLLADKQTSTCVRTARLYEVEERNYKAINSSERPATNGCDPTQSPTWDLSRFDVSKLFLAPDKSLTSKRLFSSASRPHEPKALAPPSAPPFRRVNNMLMSHKKKHFNFLNA